MLIIFYNFSMRFLMDTIYKSLCNDYCFAYVKSRLPLADKTMYEKYFCKNEFTLNIYLCQIFIVTFNNIHVTYHFILHIN